MDAHPAAPLAPAALEWLRAQLPREPVGANGEPAFTHALGTRAILQDLGADDATLDAASLFVGVPPITLDQIEKAFGFEVRSLVDGLCRLMRLRTIAAASAGSTPMAAGAGASADTVATVAPTKRAAAHTEAGQVETLRRMLLAMSADIRVVLLRLASRLQTLRYHVSIKVAPEVWLCRDSLDVLAPLANRLGIWQLKWEMEDLAFRFLEPEQYRAIAAQLEERRAERELYVEQAIARLRSALQSAGIQADVSGRPKHLYSIASKMRAKGLQFEQVQDLRAFRVIVADIRACYAVLSLVHSLWDPMPREFDDYIARPKSNGYRSLHTVVLGEDGRPFEIQIRTHAMHQHAEYGVAAHWRYKERSTGLAGAASADVPNVENDRIAWVRQLLAWQREMGEHLGAPNAAAPQPPGVGGGTRPSGVPVVDPHIYVLTPQARVVELPTGATPLDFAYQIHTDLGHRCRGARVDGHLVPLETPLANGQTVEILSSRAPEAGPSRDWLNPARAYLASARARSKVRQWFTALDIERDVASGRQIVERVLAREGRTAIPFDAVAQRLGLADARALFLAMAREEVGPRALEDAVRAPLEAPLDDAKAAASEALREAAREDADALARWARPKQAGGLTAKGTGASASGVLVVGVDVLSQLARCCRPVPPDPVQGFVTRGRGISIHRADCRSLAELARRMPERVLDAAWDARPLTSTLRFPAQIELRANDRPGLLRDVSDLLARDRINVTAVQTQTRGDIASMRFTIEVASRDQALAAMKALRGVAGVLEVSRR